MRLISSLGSLKKTVGRKLKGFRFGDYFMMTLVAIAGVVLAIITVTYVMAATTRLSSYKTPIPLAKDEYATGEIIQGYFDGSKYYAGKVTIKRQLICNYGYADTLPDLRSGEDVVTSLVPPGPVDKNLARNIAKVPDDVRQGASCFVTFNHTACVPYLFGCYNVEYAYVSLPFIIKKAVPTPDNPNPDGGNTTPTNDSNRLDNQRVVGGGSSNQQTTPGGVANGTPPPSAVTPPEDETGVQQNPIQQTLQGINNVVDKYVKTPVVDLLGGLGDILGIR